MDFHYEFRHPGHGDQGVHNPYKGGGVPAGFVRPVALNPDDVHAPGALTMSDEEFYVTAKANGLNPNTLDVDTFTAADKVTAAQYRVIEHYKQSSSFIQDGVLGRQRGTASQFADSQRQAKVLKSTLESRELPEAATLHRGMGGEMTARLQQAGVGGVVKTDRFVSTSASARGANGFGSAVLEINAPAGTKGAYIDRILMAGRTKQQQTNIGMNAKQSANPRVAGELEFVMPPGVKFRVDSIGTIPKLRFGQDKPVIVPFVKVTIVP